MNRGLGFGAAPIGNLYSALDEDTALATVNAAWESGIRVFDTAPHYGLGLSERRLGLALRSRPRDDYSISTKVGRLLVPNPRPQGRDPAGFAVPDDLTRVRDYSATGVRRSIEESLERLGVEHIDTALVHDPEEHLEQTIHETIPALVRMRDEGLITEVGAGMNFVDPLVRLVQQTDLDVVMVAGRWTLLDRRAAPLAQVCSEHDVRLLAASPFNSGVLAHDPPAMGATFDYLPAPSATLRLAQRLSDICHAYDVPLQAAALQFPLRAACVSHVVAGFRTPHEVRQSAAWFDHPIPTELWDRLDAATASGVGQPG